MRTTCLLSIGYFGERLPSAHAALSSTRSRIKSQDRERGLTVPDNNAVDLARAMVRHRLTSVRAGYEPLHVTNGGRSERPIVGRATHTPTAA